MAARTGRSRLIAFGAFVALWVPSLQAQVADPDPQRFAAAFEEFAEWDTKNYVPENGIVMVGSSSIVRWNSAESFPGLPIINRGFGGSQASDIIPWVEEAVLKYDPAVVVYYAGDNDTEAGKGAEQIFEDIRTFTEAVLAHDPATQVVILSVKPSPRRWQWQSVMLDTNAMIRRYADTLPTVHYVDVATPMLGRDGQPISNLYVEDRLHMTAAGYDVWNRVLSPVLHQLQGDR